MGTNQDAVLPVACCISVSQAFAAAIVLPSLPCSLPPVQWPSLVRPLSPVISEMPGMVLERYNACQVGWASGMQSGGQLLSCCRILIFFAPLCSIYWPPAARPQTVAFCGVFPEIKRAWASVDNSLFLWRFDKWWVCFRAV